MDRSLQEFVREMVEFMPKYLGEAHRKFSITSMRDVTISHIVILGMLKASGSCTMSEIAKAMHATTSAATGMVDRMVRAGLLKRAPSVKDRRIINIEATQKGRKVADDIQAQRQKFVMDVFSKLKPTEREGFLGTMKKIYNIIKEEHN
ncbi:MAG: MarR family transcriptional regulator [Candidatus Omnitrophota bacterium]